MIDPAFDEDEEGIEEAAEPIEAAAPASRPEVRPVPRISIQAFCESPDLAATIEAI